MEINVTTLNSYTQIMLYLNGVRLKAEPPHSCIAAQRHTKPLSLQQTVPLYHGTALRRADDVSFRISTDIAAICISI